MSRAWAQPMKSRVLSAAAQGSREACAELLALLKSGATPGLVTGVSEQWSPARAGVAGFVER